MEWRDKNNLQFKAIVEDALEIFSLVLELVSALFPQTDQGVTYCSGYRGLICAVHLEPFKMKTAGLHFCFCLALIAL